MGPPRPELATPKSEANASFDLAVRPLAGSIVCHGLLQVLSKSAWDMGCDKGEIWLAGHQWDPSCSARVERLKLPSTAPPELPY